VTGALYASLGNPTANDAYYQNAWQTLPTTGGFAVRSWFASQMETGLGAELVRGLTRDFTDPVRPWYLDPQGDAIRAADLNERYGIPGRLEFRRAMSERAAAELYGVRQREIAAERLMEAAGVGAGVSLATSLAAGLVDPANIALSFTPLPWINRLSRFETGMNAASRIGLRAGTGALEGAIGAAMIEPLVYAMNRDEGNDYTFADSLMNVFVGAGAGAVFRPLLLGGIDALGAARTGGPDSRPDWQQSGADGAEPDSDLLDDAGLVDPTDLVDLDTVDPARLPEDFAARVRPLPDARQADPMPAIAERASDGTRLLAMAKSVDDVFDGAPVDVAPVFDAGVRGGLDELDRFGQTRRLDFEPLKSGVAITPDNTELDVTYALVELDDLVPSHGLAGDVNPDYPAALQPRDRAQVASAVQIHDIARNLNPARLGETFNAGDGAPVVGADGLVESGNGRVLALMLARLDHPEKWAAYQDWLAAQGHDMSRFEAGVLVRVAAARPAAQRVAFAQGGNGRATAGYSVAEQAKLDARGLTPEDLAALKDGSTGDAINADFARKALERLATAADYPDLVDGRALTVKGRARLDAAVVQVAYEDSALTVDLFDGRADELKGLGEALTAVAPAWARMRAAVARGEIAPGADATPALQAALTIARRARQKGVRVAEEVATRDMFDELTPATQAFLRLLFGDDLTRQAGRARIEAGLRRYVTQAELADPNPGLFGDAPAGADEIAAVALRAGETEGDAGAMQDLQALQVAAAQRSQAQAQAVATEAKLAPAKQRPEAQTDQRALNEITKTLAPRPDPELDRLMAGASEIEAEIATLADNGDLSPDLAADMARLSADPADAASATARRAAVLCLLSNPAAIT
jgi:hypothetical protein